MLSTQCYLLCILPIGGQRICTFETLDLNCMALNSILQHFYFDMLLWLIMSYLISTALHLWFCAGLHAVS